MARWRGERGAGVQNIYNSTSLLPSTCVIEMNVIQKIFVCPIFDGYRSAVRARSSGWSVTFSKTFEIIRRTFENVFTIQNQNKNTLCSQGCMCIHNTPCTNLAWTSDLGKWQKLEKNRKKDFFEKSKKPLFYVDVETLYPEVQVSNVNSVPTVAWYTHTHTHIYTSENRNPTHPMLRGVFAGSGVRRFVGGG